MSILRFHSVLSPLELEQKMMKKLFRAIFHHNVEIVQDILARKCIKNINSMADKTYTPLYLAMRHGAINCAVLLLEAGANPNIPESGDGWTPLIVCIRVTKNIDNVRLLLSYGADQRISSHVGRNAWVYAKQLRRSHPDFSRKCRQLFDDWQRAYVFSKRWKINAKLKRRQRERNLLKYIMKKKNKQGTEGLVENRIKEFLNHSHKKIIF